MRKVMTYTKKWDDTSKKYIEEEDGEGIFVQYGYDYMEFESGAGNFTTAIVEMPNGRVKSIPAENIRFLDVGVMDTTYPFYCIFGKDHRWQDTNEGYYQWASSGTEDKTPPENALYFKKQQCVDCLAVRYVVVGGE